MALAIRETLEEMQDFLDWKRRHHPDWPDLRLEWGLFQQLLAALSPGEEKSGERMLRGRTVLEESLKKDQPFAAFLRWKEWMDAGGFDAAPPSPDSLSGDLAERLGNPDLASLLLKKVALENADPVLLLASRCSPYSRIFSAMCEFLAVKGSREEALEAAAWAALLSGEPARHWSLSAHVESICGEPDSVASGLEEGLRSCPGHPDLLRELARELERLGKLDLAIEKMEEAVEARPAWPDLRFELARLYRDSEQEEESLEQFGKALELNPSYEQAATLRAELFQSLGETLPPDLDDLVSEESPHHRIYRMLSEVYAERGDERRADYFAKRGAKGSSRH
ncbi:MAG: tetratricopeptide repeat protein [Candidatus Krumholzibacteria bacterium]|jgi:tetratricopeptide (TPR) repeat protein|nr:tetratricopeptide repeat protein [Candidatus Krumholzibacteria bacterium]MDP6668698.1 tetratricopeptide repeat protein [Candidatus Krumholzibacteria bacterium]MDP6797860.1 tetratricopeptide repeat protein [Candidatus Krumholzibacteria bacterium]MDP7022399.1 tetratricopeptide repeat protein [Candidatus Krumholzibacteria bacterium]